jgi:predicted GIY-YIG superfamily endonuclease
LRDELNETLLRGDLSESDMAVLMREGYTVHLPCPVHLNHTWCDSGYPFKCNIRVRPGRETYTSLKPDHSFIYKITHVRTGMLYVGFTDELSRRWAGHRSDSKNSEMRKSKPLSRAMYEDGLNMFVMEALEECAAVIQRRRELDYMRNLDSWNPKKGYNGLHEEADYARKLCFLLDPALEVKYTSIWQERNSVVAGFGKPLPPGYEWLEKQQQELEEALQRDGRRLMETIPSFLSPEILASPAPLVFRKW